MFRNRIKSMFFENAVGGHKGNNGGNGSNLAS